MNAVDNTVYIYIVTCVTGTILFGSIPFSLTSSWLFLQPDYVFIPPFLAYIGIIMFSSPSLTLACVCRDCIVSSTILCMDVVSYNSSMRAICL